MVTISLCMIVRNEERVLANCLESIKDAVDEIIIVDTGSQDNTEEIAKKYTDKIYDFTWVDDFSAARNFAYEKATMDYQMWLDADDIVPKEEVKKLRALKETLKKNVDMVSMKYHTHFDENGKPILTSTRERLTKTDKHLKWIDPVHEHIPLRGNVLHSDITMWHRKPAEEQEVSTRNLDIYNKLEQSGKELTPRQVYYFARELKDHGQWAKSTYYFEKFLGDGEGWLEDNIASCLNLSICYHQLKEEEKVLPVLLRSFTYDSPRAETCCEIGYFYKRKKEFRKALNWFELATFLPYPDSMGFVMEDYRGYIPCIEACVCLINLGEYKLAKEYNRLAGEYKPGNTSVVQNEKYLTTLLNQATAK